jgi:hypothetical protein
MWDRLLYGLRARTPDLGRGLGSWRLSIVLMVLAALYYALLAIWASSSPPHVVQNIASLAPFSLLYALLLVNTVVCLWSRLDVLKHQLSARPSLDHTPPDWEHRTGPTAGAEAGTRAMRRLGYRPRPTADGGWWGVRRRWSALGTYLFHGAFLLIAAGFLLSLLTRHEAKVWVAVGEEFSGRPEQFLSQSPPRMASAGLPSGSFRATRITAEFWRDQLLFTQLGAELAMPGRREVTTRINDPIWWDWSSFLRLSGFGYAPRYEIVDRDGAVLDSAFVKLNVFPPGQRDFFKTGHYPHRFYVEILPDYAEVDGEPITRSLNLVRPAVQLRVLRGKVDLGSATLLAGRGFTFEGLTLRFPEVRYWGEFSIVRDPGMPVLFGGYLIGLVGLVLRLRGPRSEVGWRAEPGGGGVLRGWGGAVPEPETLAGLS